MKRITKRVEESHGSITTIIQQDFHISMELAHQYGTIAFINTVNHFIEN